ncbi:helix-turn-helix domain-containing protein [Phormidium sp. FACHB-592]|uniref:Helix-turn-helix domain-containing protein n=1 Tax=Stenomitos frigidus AS-A4 TaxID=2933935 RepID=A0ABV0KUG6_9CYAN|nr:helix-turn-helix domain-containing protein [Phormidium sp. FACHB-592]MBD2077290.1 helix-turn-helix domain-containing protein [Phormidium sp. FACHB-592]
MPAPLQVKLTVEEDTTIRELSLATEVPRRTRQRAIVIRLNSAGWRVGQIAQHLQLHEHSVRRAIRQWQRVGLYGLWEKRRPGRQHSWHEADVKVVEQWLQEEHSYTSPQLCPKLASERQVHLSQRSMSRLLQKRGSVGNACAIVHLRQNSQSM